MIRPTWTSAAGRCGEVWEREFCVERSGEPIPGVVWYSARSAGRCPLVLLGHGGSGHRRSAKMLKVGQLFAHAFGWWTAAIDGPVHGARGPVTDASDPAYRQMWQRVDIVQSMIDDWRTVLDALGTLDEVDATRIGYWGVSMGTMFGLPLVAADARIRACVLGKAGMRGSSVARSGIDKHFRDYAAKVTIPLLFVVQWDDERFDRDGQFELYEMLGSADKRLHAYPGLHADDGPESFEAAGAFLRRYLNP